VPKVPTNIVPGPGGAVPSETEMWMAAAMMHAEGKLAGTSEMGAISRYGRPGPNPRTMTYDKLKLLQKEMEEEQKKSDTEAEETLEKVVKQDI